MTQAIDENLEFLLIFYRFCVFIHFLLLFFFFFAGPFIYFTFIQPFVYLLFYSSGLQLKLFADPGWELKNAETF